MTALPRSMETPAIRLTWAGPLFMLFARFLFALLFQCLTAIFFSLRGDATLLQSAAPWWTVYGSLIDIARLISIAFMLRGGDLMISALIDFKREFFCRDIHKALLLVFIFLVVGVIAGTLAGILIYGGPPPVIMGTLPLWGALYSLFIWPVLWGFTKQLTYQGYVLPRLQNINGKTWLTISMIVVGYALQHTACP